MKKEHQDFSPFFTVEELEAILEDVEREGGMNGQIFTNVDELIESLFKEFGDNSLSQKKFPKFISNIYQKLLSIKRPNR